MKGNENIKLKIQMKTKDYINLVFNVITMMLGTVMAQKGLPGNKKATFVFSVIMMALNFTQGLALAIVRKNTSRSLTTRDILDMFMIAATELIAILTVIFNQVKYTDGIQFCSYAIVFVTGLQQLLSMMLKKHKMKPTKTEEQFTHMNISPDSGVVTMKPLSSLEPEHELEPEPEPLDKSIELEKPIELEKLIT